MAKLYGTLIGTAVQAVAAGGAVVPNRYKDGMDEVLWRDLVTLNGNIVGDQISLGLYRSTAYFDQGNSFIWFGAAGAGCTLQVGDATHPSALGTANIAAVGVTGLIPTFLAAFMGQALWQRLGWASDPGGTIELLGTLAGAAPANVQISWQAFGRNV